MKTIFLVLLYISCGLLLVTCKKENPPNQIGLWDVNQVTEIFSNENLNTYVSDFDLDLQEDETASYIYDSHMIEFEYDLLGEGRQILLYTYDFGPNIDSLINPSFYHYNIVVDEKDYQEWHLLQEKFFNSELTWRREDTFILHRK